ncbi:MAG TPA: hypothetical protein VIY96_10105 [Thermoanaerobaculia bacterium]
MRLPTAVVDRGDPLLTAWILAWDQRQIVRDPRDLFEANIFHPFPDALAYSEPILGPSLLAAPARLFTSNAIAVQNVAILTAFLALALGSYFFFQWASGDRVAAAAGAALVSLSPVRFAHLGHVQLLQSVALPLLVYALWRYLETPRRAFALLVCGAFLFEVITSFYLLLMAVVAAGVVVACGVVRLGARQTLRSLGGLAPWLVGTALLSLPFVLPYYRLAQTQGHTRSLETETLYFASHKDYVKPVWGSLASRIAGIENSLPRGRSLYLGSIVLGLAAIAVFRRRDTDRRERTAVFLLASLALVFLALSFGGWRTFHGRRFLLPFYWLHELPGFNGIRAPSRFAIVADFAVVGLAAIGLAQLIRLAAARGGRPAAVTLAAGVGIFALLERAPALPFAPGESVEVGREIPHVYRWLAADSADARVLELPMLVGPGKREPWDVVPYRQVYFSTVHWKPIVNGTSGYLPPGYSDLTQEMRAFPAAPAIETLFDLPIDRVVVHRDLYEVPIPTSLFDGRFRVRHDCPEDLVLEMTGRTFAARPDPRPRLRLLSTSGSTSRLALEWTGDVPGFLYPPVRFALTAKTKDSRDRERRAGVARWLTDLRSPRTFRIEAGSDARSLTVEASTDSGERASTTVPLRPMAPIS